MTPRIAAAAFAFLAGCSILPPAEYPPHRDHHLEVLYVLPLEGDRAVQVPASGPDLTIYELETVPPGLAERFEQGRRLLVAPPDVDTVLVRVRYRTFDGSQERAEEFLPERLFPHATSIRQMQ